MTSCTGLLIHEFVRGKGAAHLTLWGARL